MGVPLILSVKDPQRGCRGAALSLQASRNAEKTLLYLEIHHCDVNPNIMASGVGGGSARLLPA